MFTLLFFNIEFLSHLQYINADFCHDMCQNHAACCVLHFTAMFVIHFESKVTLQNMTFFYVG